MDSAFAMDMANDQGEPAQMESSFSRVGGTNFQQGNSATMMKSSVEQPKVALRSFFPETWLFSLEVAGQQEINLQR